MRVRLDNEWVQQLRRMPESGMGYQRVDIRFANGAIAKDVLVFNAQDLELPDEVARLDIASIDLGSSKK
jgi:hypothetical protein